MNKTKKKLIAKNENKEYSILEKEKDKLKSKYLEEPERILDTYFPKGKSKKRGEALAVLVIAFINGIKCGEEYERLK